MFGFGFSGWAQSKFVKVFCFFFSKKEALSLRASRGLTLPEYGNKLGT
jgi:hypothetical protein